MSADRVVVLCMWKEVTFWEPLVGSIKWQRLCSITTLTTSGVIGNYFWASQCEIWGKKKKGSLIMQTNQRKLHKMTLVKLHGAILTRLILHWSVLRMCRPLASSAVMVSVYCGAVPSMLSACTVITPESRSTRNKFRGVSGIWPTSR